MKYILIADDETVNQMIVEEMLEDSYETAAVNDGIECLESINIRMPDMLLLDISMPRMDGFEVCRKLRTNEATKALPIIMLSGHAHNEYIQQGFEAGANKYITKPFSMNELKEAIAELI